MFARYDELNPWWSDTMKYLMWGQVLLASMEELDGPTPGEVAEVEAFISSASIEKLLPEITAMETVTRHDVEAFIRVLGKRVDSPAKVWLHLGLTSSDVVDTGQALIIRAVGRELDRRMVALSQELHLLAQDHVGTFCVGRTHGKAAQATTYGIRFAGHCAAVRRATRHLREAFKEASVGTISGPVGAYQTHDPYYEERVLTRLGSIERELVPTQVVSRDRHARLLSEVALAGGVIERLALEVRLLARTDCEEVAEGRTFEQVGSSSMPHKENPITCEKVTGLARLLRGYAVAGMEDVALHHERDISHSSVERIALPDATNLLAHMATSMAEVMKFLVVRHDNIQDNLNASGIDLQSATRMVMFQREGMSREDARIAVLETVDHVGEFSQVDLLKSSEEIVRRLA